MSSSPELSVIHQHDFNPGTTPSSPKDATTTTTTRLVTTPQTLPSPQQKHARPGRPGKPTTTEKMTLHAEEPQLDEELVQDSAPSSPATPPGSPPSLPVDAAASQAVSCEKLPPSPPPAAATDDDDDDDYDGKNNNKAGKEPPLCARNIKRWVDGNIGLISAKVLAAVIDHHYSSPLPATDQVFPWLHGLNPENVCQRAFLNPKTRRQFKNGLAAESVLHDNNDELFQMPTGAKGLMLVKVGDYSNEMGSLVGSVTPQEMLTNCKQADPYDNFGDKLEIGVEDLEPEFINMDPITGISLRNFHIQVAKWACLSNIVVYSPDPNEADNLVKVAKLMSAAQAKIGQEYRTFMMDESIDEVLKLAPHVVSIPPKSMKCDEDELRLKNWDSNFLFHERVEMSMMSSASKINDSTVWLGNTVDFETYVDMYQRQAISQEGCSEQDLHALKSRNWVTFIDCYDGAQIPTVMSLEKFIHEAEAILKEGPDTNRELTPLTIQFPGSGSLPLASHGELDDYCAIATLCKLIYLRSQVTYRGGQAGVLICCNDGYSETSLLGLIYIAYSTGVSPSQAWLDLHVKYGRPFFCFRRDVVALQAIYSLIKEYSPSGDVFSGHEGGIHPNEHAFQVVEQGKEDNNALLGNEDSWFSRVDGSAPSKILPHMYLGSLVHGDNPEMLAKLGIKRVLSVGECPPWVKWDDPMTKEMTVDNPYEGITKVKFMSQIEDDGIDPLMGSLAKCLEFLDEGYRLEEPVLVHCRVGVSRSATVCIAEVMKRLGVGLPRAYLFVRVRRLNVIIQPNLRFMYELVKWEEIHRQDGEGWLREVDWHILCREITIMNKAYIQ